MRKETMKNKNLIETLKFGGVSLLLLGFFIFLLQTFELVFLQNWIAEVVSGFFEMEVNGNLFSFQGGIFQINNYCTGLYSISLLAALLIPLKTIVLKQKVRLFLLGSTALFLINIIRVAVIVWAGINYGLETAETVHAFSWAGMGLLVFVAWFKALAK